MIQPIKWRKKQPPRDCIDCGKSNPGFFWVKESVWKEAGFQNYNDGIICLSCLAKRLKRTIVPEDFDDNGPCSNDAILFMYNV